MIVNNAMNTDLKNMFARLYDIFCFLSLHRFNSIYATLHYLHISILQKDLQSVLVFRVHKFKCTPYLSVF